MSNHGIDFAGLAEVLGFPEEELQLHSPSRIQEMIQTCIYIFSNKFSMINGIAISYKLSPEPIMTWTNDDLLSIEPLLTNFSEIWIKIQWFSFKKVH